MILNRIESGIATKYLVQVHESSAEITRIERPDKTIICFSTQIGCPIGCKFCASGMSGFIRSMTMAEMYKIIQAAYRDPASPFMQGNIKPLLLSAMGEGEPAFLISNLCKLWELTLTDTVKGAVSTSGPSRKHIRKMVAEFAKFDVKIQYSLHSANQEVRKFLMPRAKADPKQVLDVLRDYPKVELNIVLFEGINDGIDDVKAIVDLLDSVPNNWKIKLNRGNQILGGPTPVSSEKMDWFAAELRNIHDYDVELYFTDGADINAACGQLRSPDTKVA